VRTDQFFYRLFLQLPGLLAELIPGIPADAVYEFTAPVLKESEFRLDGVLVPESDDPDCPVVILESQMYRDPGFYGRYFAEVHIYLRQYPSEREWRGLLILKDRSLNLGSERPYRLYLEQQVERIYLDELAVQAEVTGNMRLLQLVSLPEARLVAKAQEILGEEVEAELKQQRLNLIEMILSMRLPNLSQEEVRRMLDLKEADLKKSRFYQEIWQEGRQEGRREGRREEAAAMILRQLSRRIGSVSESQGSRISLLSLDRLEDLGEALLDFQNSQDLEKWLGSED
jgi:predicted transposase/invertase (TIGR01784 family)